MLTVWYYLCGPEASRRTAPGSLVRLKGAQQDGNIVMFTQTKSFENQFRSGASLDGGTPKRDVYCPIILSIPSVRHRDVSSSERSNERTNENK